MSCFPILLAVILTVSAIPLETPKRLIKTSESKPAEWLSESEIQKLIANDQGFIDVTNIKEHSQEAQPSRRTNGNGISFFCFA